MHRREQTVIFCVEEIGKSYLSLSIFLLRRSLTNFFKIKCGVFNMQSRKYEINAKMSTYYKALIWEKRKEADLQRRYTWERRCCKYRTFLFPLDSEREIEHLDHLFTFIMCIFPNCCLEPCSFECQRKDFFYGKELQNMSAIFVSHFL